MLKKLLARTLGLLQGMPKEAAGHFAAISDYAESFLGPSTRVLHEHYSPDIHVDLIHYAPHGDRDFHYLITSGMSDLPMTDGGEPVRSSYGTRRRVATTLGRKRGGIQEPCDLPTGEASEAVGALSSLQPNYFAKGHTIPLGDEPLLHPMQAVLLMPPVLVPGFREPLVLAGGETIQFMAVYLLHQDELDAKLAGGLDRLLEGFANREVTEIYDPQRASVLA